MGEKEDGETKTISLARQGRKAWAFVGNWRWRGGMLLSCYEIAFGITPYVLSLELSSWARYNLWAYLMLHSAAFFKALWASLAEIFRRDEAWWNGNFPETDLLLVSIAILVRKRKQAPASFPHLSLVDLLKDARCVGSIDSEDIGLNSLFPPECPFGTATIILAESDRAGDDMKKRGLATLAPWQVPADIQTPCEES